MQFESKKCYLAINLFRVRFQHVQNILLFNSSTSPWDNTAAVYQSVNEKNEYIVLQHVCSSVTLKIGCWSPWTRNDKVIRNNLLLKSIPKLSPADRRISDATSMYTQHVYIVLYSLYCTVLIRQSYNVQLAWRTCTGYTALGCEHDKERKHRWVHRPWRLFW